MHPSECPGVVAHARRNVGLTSVQLTNASPIATVPIGELWVVESAHVIDGVAVSTAGYVALAYSAKGDLSTPDPLMEWLEMSIQHNPNATASGWKGFAYHGPFICEGGSAIGMFTSGLTGVGNYINVKVRKVSRMSVSQPPVNLYSPSVDSMG